MFDFFKYRFLYFLISGIVIAAGIFSIAVWGYRFSIEFSGGTNLEYSFSKKPSEADLNKIINKDGLEVIDLKLNGQNLTLRSKSLAEKQETAFKADLEKQTKSVITVLKSETVGPVLGQETMFKTLIASVLAVLGILIYMSFAFKGFNYAAAAIIAMIHDFLVVIGSYSLISHFFGAEIDTMFVTAVLTTMSFSVHDTIVIFDKIREYLREEGRGDIVFYSNKALTETMVRSVNNSMTIVFMLLALSLMGGSTIKYFVITLLIGTVTGTYSSPFIATPILVYMEGRKNKGK